jgi:branched-chain amino acid transport system permease protein
MDNLFVALFEILSFGAIVVLVVLGLGIIASMMGIFNFAQGEFVCLAPMSLSRLGGRRSGSECWLRPLSSARWVCLERTIVRRFYATPIVAMLGTYTQAHHPRDRPRFDRRVVSVGPGAAPGSVNIGTMHFSTWRLVIISLRRW